MLSLKQLRARGTLLLAVAIRSAVGQYVLPHTVIAKGRELGRVAEIAIKDVLGEKTGGVCFTRCEPLHAQPLPVMVIAICWQNRVSEVRPWRRHCALSDNRFDKWGTAVHVCPTKAKTCPLASCLVMVAEGGATAPQACVIPRYVQGTHWVPLLASRQDWLPFGHNNLRCPVIVQPTHGASARMPCSACSQMA